MMSIQYVEVREMENRGAVEPAPSSEVDGSLLVGVEPALEFDGNESRYGSDSIEIFPAFYKGERAWLRRETWQAAYGYSAIGTQESILSFEEGVKIFLEHGAFAFPVPVEA